MKVSEIIRLIELEIPLGLQESYDNAGLVVGDPETIVAGILTAVDLTEQVLAEAGSLGANMILCHHPPLFKGIKSLVPGDRVNDMLIRCVKEDIVVYAAHTNLDKIAQGISSRLAEAIGLLNTRILAPEKNSLKKLVVFLPSGHLQSVREALFDAGAGHIGQYDSCSFTLDGTGTFKGGDGTTPYVGKAGSLHEEPEHRLEVILPDYIESRVVKALHSAHPYEEVAYDMYSLSNRNPFVGLGIVGDLPEPMEEKQFMSLLKSKLSCDSIRHTDLRQRKVQRVAVCGGSGSEFLQTAIQAGADVYVSGDFKYHQFFEAANRIVVADVGHYESEQFAKELLKELVIKKIPNFAVHLSKINTNPINYF